MIRRFKESIPQWIIIFAIFSLFMVEAVMAHLRDRLIVPARAWVIGLICIAGLIALIAVTASEPSRRTEYADKLRHPDKWMLLLIALVIAVRIPMLGTTQRVDGGVYYGALLNAAETFDFTMGQIWATFRLAAHTSLAYTFFSLLGEFLTPGSTVGVNLVCAIMTAAAVACLYKIERRLLPDLNPSIAFISLAVIQFTPLFWGTYSYVQLDYMYLIFFVFMWYTHLNKEYILTCLWMICVVMTKETGGIILLGYYLVFFLKLFFEDRGVTIKDRFKKVFSDPIFSILLLGAALLAGYFVKQGAFSVWTPASDAAIEGYSWFIDAGKVQTYGQDAASFGIYPKYIICKFIHFFILGFNWIASGTIAVCAVLTIRNKRFPRKMFTDLLPLFGAMGAYALFNMVYITWCHARYIVFFSEMLWFVAALLVCHAFFSASSVSRDSAKEARIRILSAVAAGVCALLLILQTFMFIDPVSNLIFDHLDTGRGDMLYTSMRVHFFGDQVVSSYRYTYIDGLLDKMLDKAGYTDEMQIVQWDGYVDQSQIDHCGRYNYGWEPEKGHRVVITQRMQQEAADTGVITDDGRIVYPLNLLYDETYEGQAGQSILVYFMPYTGQNEDECLAPFLKDYSITKQERIYNWGGYLDYYVLARTGNE
ncbi:MAG: hypothetical protein K6F54_10700 [Lachnospiraceae bacterium]|nr:hypothetical protein [Lachnospiraceae bacterium]